MIIGYARVSTDEQTTDPQVDQLTAAGCERIFVDHGVSGAKAHRPHWDECLAIIRSGDVLTATKLDRFSRSLKHLLSLAEWLEDRGAQLHTLDGAVDTTTAYGKAFFQLRGVFAELELNLMLERTQDGLAAARARGRVGGSKPKLTPAQVRKMKKLYDARQLTGRQIAEQFGIHYTTMYDYLRAAS